MSFDNKNTETKTHEELASNYALQVALQTMKERCQQLQSRLSTVEDENLQLKIEKQKLLQHETNVTSSSDVDKLQEQIAQLNRQKSQLTHHIYMVATENKHLWTRLSLLTEANESLGTRLNKISNTLSSQTLNKSNLLTNEQYTTEITDLPSVKNFDFPLSNDDEEYSDNEDENAALLDLMVEDLKRYKEQLWLCLTKLKEQQNLLSVCYSKLKLFSEGSEKCNVCNNCNVRKNVRPKEFCDIGVSVMLPDLIENDGNLNDIADNTVAYLTKERICPICAKTYDYSGDFNTFLGHVQQHFPEEEDDEYQSDSLLYGGSSSLI